jgi:hypothetical protein
MPHTQTQQSGRVCTCEQAARQQARQRHAIGMCAAPRRSHRTRPLDCWGPAGRRARARLRARDSSTTRSQTYRASKTQVQYQAGCGATQQPCARVTRVTGEDSTPPRGRASDAAPTARAGPRPTSTLLTKPRCRVCARSCALPPATRAATHLRHQSGRSAAPRALRRRPRPAAARGRRPARGRSLPARLWCIAKLRRDPRRCPASRWRRPSCCRPSGRSQPPATPRPARTPWLGRKTRARCPPGRCLPRHRCQAPSAARTYATRAS